MNRRLRSPPPSPSPCCWVPAPTTTPRSPARRSPTSAAENTAAAARPAVDHARRRTSRGPSPSTRCSPSSPADRHRRRGRQGRRHRHDGPEGGAHRGQPGGRRDVRRRQHVPVRGRRRQGLRPVQRRRASADVPKELTALVPGGEATPVDVGDVCINVDTAWFDEHQLRAAGRPRRPRRPGIQGPPRRREPGVVVARAWRSCWPRSSKYGDDGWVDYWERCGRTACRSSTRGPTPTTAPSPAAAMAPSRSSSAMPAARPPRSCSPIRRSRRRRRRASTRRASARSSSPACCAAPQHTDEARQLVDFMVSTRFQSALPLNLFVYPANSTVELPKVFTANATVPADAGDDGPGDDRRQPPGVARHVDRRGAALSAEPSSRSSLEAARSNRRPTAGRSLVGARRRPGRLPRRLLRVAVRRAARERTAPERHRRHARSGQSTWRVAWFTLWQAVASTVGDDRHRARAGVRHRPLRVRRAATCSTPCSPRCSCCRPS